MHPALDSVVQGLGLLQLGHSLGEKTRHHLAQISRLTAGCGRDLDQGVQIQRRRPHQIAGEVTALADESRRQLGQVQLRWAAVRV